MRKLILLTWLLASSAQAATLYPCSLSPAPVLCYGTAKLASAYTGNAFDLYNPNTAATTSVGFSGDALDTTVLDTFRNGSFVNITKWYEQISSMHLVQPITPTTGNATINSAIVTNLGSTTGAAAKKGVVGAGVLFNSTVSTVDGSTQVTMTEAATASGTGVPIAFTSAPKIDTLTVGNARAVIFQGESTLGAFDFMTTPDISALGITAKDYTITVVVIPSSAMYVNQAGAPDVSLGALFDFVSAVPITVNGDLTASSPTIANITTTGIQVGDVIGASGVQLPVNAAVQAVGPGNQITMTVNANTGSSTTTALTFARPVVRAYNNANAAVRGAWSVDDGSGFELLPTDAWIQITPLVLSITSDSTGVKLWQNGQIRATASRSALTRTAAYLYLGKLANAVAGTFGRGFGGEVAAVVVHNVGLTQYQQAELAAALWQRFGIDFNVSKPAANLVTVFSDSIGASYKTLGTYGYADYLMITVSLPARVSNYGVPGSTCSQNPAGGPAYANTTGLFPLAGAPVLTAQNANKGRVAIFHLGGNDTFGPEGRTGTKNGTTTIALADTSGLTVGDYVFTTGISTLTTISSINPGVSITVSSAVSGSGVVLVQFIYAASSPTAIYNCIAALVTAANTAGATKSIVSTILLRDDNFFPWRNAINALIVGGVSGATVVNCAAFPGLDTNPGPSFADSAHLTALGHQQMAACLLSTVNSGLTPRRRRYVKGLISTRINRSRTRSARTGSRASSCAEQAATGNKQQSSMLYSAYHLATASREARSRT